MQVVYEKLPNFCFLCGILGHEEVNCPKIYVDNFIEPDGELSYGNWMRVNGVEIGLQVALKPVDCSWARKGYRHPLLIYFCCYCE